MKPLTPAEEHIGRALAVALRPPDRIFTLAAVGWLLVGAASNAALSRLLGAFL